MLRHAWPWVTQGSTIDGGCGGPHARSVEEWLAAHPRAGTLTSEVRRKQQTRNPYEDGAPALFPNGG
jgi:hypothetical protein